MTLIQTIILAIVEGLTEFLPVSSTGHLIVTQALLGVESTSFVKAFSIIIQFAAILAVVLLYWRKFFNPPHRAIGESWWSSLWPFYLKLIVGVVPAVIVGLTLKKLVDQNLESMWLVGVMLIVGGVFMIFCDELLARRTSEQTPLTYRRAFVIGLYQCLAALLPGTSRSMATIVGGMQQRLTRRAAAEFSFFLAVPTMFGAALKDTYDLVKGESGNQLFAGDNALLLAVGCLVSFVVALAAIKYFIDYVSRYGFRAFGYYRIVAGVVILALPYLGYSLKTEREHTAPPSVTTQCSTPSHAGTASVRTALSAPSLYALSSHS